MPHNRFYSPTELFLHEKITLTEREHQHAKVLRIHPQEEVEIVNGKGALAKGNVLEILKDKTQIEIFSSEKKERLSPSISLILPMMRLSKLEWIFEKGTEIGADRFILYTADFSEVKELSSSKEERLHFLMVSAMKQSGRLYLPSLEIVPSLEKLKMKEGAFFYGDPRAKNSLLLSKEERLNFITGPEKGFSEKELSFLKEKGEGTLLSPHVLRAETAPLVAVSLLSQLQL